MNNLINELLNVLYEKRETWGAGMLAKMLQKHNLHIGGERTFKKAAEILAVPYVELLIGGNICKSYSKDSANQIVYYILNNSIAKRNKDWLSLHPEVADERQSRRVAAKEAQKQKRILDKNQSDYIIQKDVLKTLHISKHKYYQLCEKLNIKLNDLAILKTDFEKIKKYLEDNYSSDPHIRSRQMAIDTWNSSEHKEERYRKLSDTRSDNVNKAHAELEAELGIKCYTPKEAAEYIGKNNSTLISGMQLLGLPMYKRNGSYIYDEESLIKLKNFYNNKNGLKGQVARLFEEYIRSKGLNYTCEKTFPDLYWHKDSKHPLRFDYYFTDYNLLVEVQGSQHFNPSSMGADISKEEIEKNFKGLQERDQLKRDYCISHSLPFIEIVSKADFAKFDKLITEIKNKKDV